MKMIADVYTPTGATQRDVENWLSRLELTTTFSETVPGRRRLFSVENTLEIALIKALTKIGMGPRSAAAFAASYLRSYSHAGRDNIRRWLVFPAGVFDKATGTNEISLEVIERAKADSDGVSILDIGSLIERVEAAFVSEG